MNKKCAEKQEQLLKENDPTKIIFDGLIKKDEKNIKEEIYKAILGDIETKDLKIRSIEIEIPKKGILDFLKDINLKDFIDLNDDFNMPGDEYPWSGNIYRYSF